jgi:branched-chain amino acid transport system ATP-binding protein
MLRVDSVTKYFRGLTAVRQVSFEVPSGSIVALIGPNGAGKTTTFNVINGIMRPEEGRVELDGRDITGLRPDQVCHAGVGRTFQIAKPLAGLSVLDNVVVGGLRITNKVAEARIAAAEILDVLDLADKRDVPAGSLTLPERKRLEVARALATGPKLLLLDEVMAGLRPNETDALVETFRQLNRNLGLTILLIEHVMRAVMALSEHVVVLNHGVLISSGTPEEVVRNPEVLECYLGEEAV